MSIQNTSKIYHSNLSMIAPDCEIGHDCTIHSHVWIGNDVKIGDDCKIQAFAFIPDGVTLADGVFIGPHVCFTNDKNPPYADFRRTYVAKNAAIGANATILPGVTIGESAKIGAGAVVTKDVPAGETWVGNPARKLVKEIPKEKLEEILKI